MTDWWRYVAFGVSLNPFWWQWGWLHHGGGGRLFAVGPFRFAWRLW